MLAYAEPEEQIRVAVVADTPTVAHHITRALRDSGYAVRPFSLSNPAAYDRVRELNPSVVVLRVSDSDPSAAHTFRRTAAHGGPALVVLTTGASPESLGLAHQSGALMHLVEPATAQSLVAAVWLAAARARDLRQLSQQLTDLRESYASRKLVERAKGVLMRRLELSEEDAHRRLQRESRNRNRKLADTAWHVIKADSELGRAPVQEEPAEAEAGAP